MEVGALQQIFIKILRSELQETELDASVKEQLTPNVIAALYSFSKRHDLAHIVWSSLYKSGLLTDPELLSKFNHEEIMAVYRHEQMKYAYSQICEILNKANIPFVPLKGSVIRPYYPDESMRTSCDIDVLIKEENLGAAVEALTQNEFKCGDRNYHDISLYSPSNVHLELHFNIQENSESLDLVLTDAWQYATPVEGSRYEFSKEFFMFHMYAHMSYHFLSGGCGIRSLMDIWVIEHKMGIVYSQAKLLLERAGIYRFAEEIHRLCEVCFSDKEGDEFSDMLLNYIFNGGVYGTTQNKVIVTKSKTSNTFMYVLKRIFLPYRDMSDQYSVLKKIPILLPLCWIARLFSMPFRGKTKRAISEFKAAKTASDDEINAIKQMRDRLGL